MNLKQTNEYIKKHNLIPSAYFNPLDDKRYYEAGIHTFVSTRSVGKTTNFLIIGLVLYWLEGIQTIYIRQFDDMIKPKNMRQIFDVIINCEYIEKITDNEYNSIYQYSRYWYLAKYDEDGKLVKKSTEPFMVCVAVNENDILKSSFAAPKGDWIIYDEFISSQNRYAPDEFFVYMDLIKTIIRDRLSAEINMLSNTIDKESKYFYEMEIRDFLEFIEPDKTEIFKTSKDTPVYFRLITASVEQKKSKLDSFKKFFGFDNAKMVAITGMGGYFSFNEYPHLKSSEEIEYLMRNIYLDYLHSKFLCCEFIYNKTRDKYMLHIHSTREPKYDDAIILVTDTPAETRQMNWHSPLGINISKLYTQGLVTFGTNSDGALFAKIVAEIKKA